MLGRSYPTVHPLLTRLDVTQNLRGITAISSGHSGNSVRTLLVTILTLTAEVLLTLIPWTQGGAPLTLDDKIDLLGVVAVDIGGEAVEDLGVVAGLGAHTEHRTEPFLTTGGARRLAGGRWRGGRCWWGGPVQHCLLDAHPSSTRILFNLQRPKIHDTVGRGWPSEANVSILGITVLT